MTEDIMVTTEHVIMSNQIRVIKSQIASLKELFKQYITNKKVPLADRWHMFASHGELMLEPDIYIIHLQELEHSVKARDMFDQRYRTYLFKEIIEMVEDGLEEDGEDSFFAGVDINRLKEEMLETGFLGFILDW